MNLKNELSKDIYEQFSTEKIIYNIKNPYLKIKFMKSYIWLFPLLISFNFIAIITGLQRSEMILYLIATITTVLAIVGFLSQSCKLYFDSSNLILENKLHKKTVIDINRYPRIYIVHRMYDSYNSTTGRIKKREIFDLHIKQDNNDIVLNIRTVGCQKIELLLNNFETKEKQEVTDSQWQTSLSEKEKIFSNYISFLDKQKKIIGVKDSSSKIKIDNNYFIKKRLKICVILTISAFILFRLFFKIGARSFEEFFMGIGAFLSIFDFFLLIILLNNGNENSLKISYPSNETIKINKYLLNYKKNNVMINIKEIQMPESNKNLNYVLILSGDKNSYSIKLNLQKTNQLEEFIDNLIFEPKNI